MSSDSIDVVATGVIPNQKSRYDYEKRRSAIIEIKKLLGMDSIVTPDTGNIEGIKPEVLFDKMSNSRDSSPVTVVYKQVEVGDGNDATRSLDSNSDATSFTLYSSLQSTTSHSKPLIPLPDSIMNKTINFIRPGDVLSVFHRFEMYKITTDLVFPDYNNITVKDILMEISVVVMNRIAADDQYVMNFAEKEFSDLEDLECIADLFKTGDLTIGHLMVTRPNFVGIKKIGNFVYVLTK